MLRHHIVTLSVQHKLLKIFRFKEKPHIYLSALRRAIDKICMYSIQELSAPRRTSKPPFRRQKIEIN